MASRKGSKKKGNVSELAVCRILSEWWDDKDYTNTRAEDLPFRRTPLSGGWDNRAKGDLIAPKNCRLITEIKNRQSWDWDGMFKMNPKWPILQWWNKLIVDSKLDFSKDCNIPILIFTKNYNPWYFVMHEEHFNLDIMFEPFIDPTGYEFAIGKLDDFIEKCSREYFRRL